MLLIKEKSIYIGIIYHKVLFLRHCLDDLPTTGHEFFIWGLDNPERPVRQNYALNIGTQDKAKMSRLCYYHTQI